METGPLTIDTPTEFTDAVDSFASEIVRVGFQTLDTTLPSTGAAVYTGAFGADYSGDQTGSVLADISMSVDFLGDNVTGSIENIFFSDGVLAGPVPGNLAIAGDTFGGDLAATAVGTLTLTDLSGVERPSAANLTLTGDFHNDGTVPLTSQPTGISGVASGGTTSGVILTLDTGFFYAER